MQAVTGKQMKTMLDALQAQGAELSRVQFRVDADGLLKTLVDVRVTWRKEQPVLLLETE